jgi:hypothetical protein
MALRRDDPLPLEAGVRLNDGESGGKPPHCKARRDSPAALRRYVVFLADVAYAGEVCSTS